MIAFALSFPERAAMVAMAVVFTIIGTLMYASRYSESEPEPEQRDTDPDLLALDEHADDSEAP